MINFNNFEARRYLIDTVCEAIRSNGVDCYREDTLPVYGGPDEEGRIGINEMKAVHAKEVRELENQNAELKEENRQLRIENANYKNRLVELGEGFNGD